MKYSPQNSSAVLQKNLPGYLPQAIVVQQQRGSKLLIGRNNVFNNKINPLAFSINRAKTTDLY
jgi:hypothetical protein